MSSVTDLLGILDLEPLEENLFRGRGPQTGWQRVFGGQVIGQALVAANRTVENRLVHSLHAYFLLGGDPKAPIIYEVDRIRDGKSFATRRVVAIQHGRPIFSLSASFQAEEPGFAHGAPMPDVPGPEELPSREEVRATIMPRLPENVRHFFQRDWDLDIKPVDYERYIAATPREARSHVWVRATPRLPEDQGVHRAVLAYLSDLTLLDTSLIPHGRSGFESTIQTASLDHAMWFHGPFRADEWLLYAQDSPSASGARGFSRGLLFTRDGRLVASVAQEGLIRRRPDLAKGAGET